MNDLERYLEQHLEDITSDIVALVEVESYSRDQRGLSEALEVVRGILRSRTPEMYTEYIVEGHEFGDTLIARFPGIAPGQVVFVGHYDTVWPRGVLADWGSERGHPGGIEFGSFDGRDTISGPGIFDMKTGLVQAIWVTKALIDLDLPRPSITLLVNGDEEIGSPTSRTLIEAEAQAADAAFVFEASHNGKIKTSRKGVGLVDVRAVGIESHAGLTPLEGASAINALMEWCLKATQLADYAAGTTINVGQISGGTGSNVIAGKAEASLDIRITTSEELQRLDRQLEEIDWTDDRVRLFISKEWNRPPMEFTPASRTLYSQLERSAQELGRRLEHTAVGGASDANFIAPLGTAVMCGVGADGAGAHARHEFIYPDSIPFFIALVALTVRNLNQQ